MNMGMIIGHGKQRSLLRRIAGGELPHHAYLFSGPEGVGKRQVAYEFAAALLGRPGADPSTSQDFLSVAPEAKKEGGKRSLSVEAVREAHAFLSRFPAVAPRRVVIVDDADRMTEAAQNALLKTLEEPNSTSVLILITARTGALRDTVISRMFRIPFTTVPEAELREGIASIPGDHSSVEPFFLTLGRPGIVLSATADPDAFASRRDALRSLFRLSSLTFSERIDLSERLASSPEETADLFEWWVTGMRATRREDVRDSRRAISLYRILAEIEETIRTLRDTNANARIRLDRLFLTVV